MDDPDSEEDEQISGDQAASDLHAAYKCSLPGIYELQSFITHLGSSIHAGHYVCHIKKEVNESDNK